VIFLNQIATKRKNSEDHGVNSFSVRVGLDNNFFRFEYLQDDENVSISSVDSLFLYFLIDF
jgi:hypothetical protein